MLLSSEGNVPVERTPALMEALLGTPVSAGFVARALARLARGFAAGFDAAMKGALQAEEVLCGDETRSTSSPKTLPITARPCRARRTPSPSVPLMRG